MQLLAKRPMVNYNFNYYPKNKLTATENKNTNLSQFGC